jgi:hypothetical protein
VLWEEHRLRASENRLLRRIFGHKRNKMTGGWRKLPKFYDLWSLSNIIRVIKLRRLR